MSFTNALRTQARLALTPCRARSALSVLRPFVHQNVVASRLLSTSRPLCFDTESTQQDSGYARPRKARQMDPHPPGPTLFVGGLPANITEEAVLEIFQDFGDIAQLTVGPKDREFWKAKYAHVQFKNVDDAIATYESAQEEPILVGGEPVRVGYAPSSRPQTNRRPPPTPSRQLFFARNGHPDVLGEVLEPFKDDIVKTLFLRDQQTREYTGQGFINFKDEEAATAAYNALRQTSHASQFYIRYATPRS